ncbi:LuxR C-terminal-related transcriptional regulator [Microbacterium sp. Marseille-Q6965]|uniref:LuxR C-terminal-related transcriptional regulator n=1 Tax=Microbacterium sp. Marseille-Q6965 TaxID=2965072 RepID=UPI0021B7B62A|nr:LuxR C-terminal-related transcriptional regulator [Microbacterium sp. Marseille-Q6965]
MAIHAETVITSSSADTSMILTRIARAQIENLDSDDAPVRLVVVGTAGSGKTKLLRRLSSQLTARGRAVATVTDADEIAGAPADTVLLLDDAHLTGADTLAAAAKRLDDPRAELVVSMRPWPRHPVLQRVTAELERARPAVVLGNLSLADVTAHLAAAGRSIPQRCLDSILEATGHLTWLVSQALAAHDDEHCPGDGRHDEIAEALRELIAHRLDSIDPELRAAVEAVCLGNPSDADAEKALAGYARGLLLRGGRPAPLLRDTVRATVPIERLARLYTEAGSDGDGRVGELIGLIRDSRVATALLMDGDRTLPRDPARADELYRGAGEAGADARLVALKRAHAAWALGQIDAAGAHIDGLGIEPGGPLSEEALGVAGAVWAARGDMRMSAATLRADAPRSPEALARATIAAVAAGDAAALDELTPSSTVATIPTALVVSLEHLVRGLRTSLTDRGRACLGDLVRATEMYTASRATTELPEVPAVIAALAAVNLGELRIAQSLLDAAIRDGHGGRWARNHLLLWRAWIAVQREHPDEAEAALTRLAASGHPLCPRDALMADAVRVALARRYADSAALTVAWRRAREGIVRAQFDLFSFIPLGEFAVTAARLGEFEEVAPHLDDALALVHRLGDPAVWAPTLHWAGVHANILANRPDHLAPHARALLTAAHVSPLAEVMAHAGRVWTAVLTGSLDADAIERAATELAGVGLAWDGARLAGYAANRTDDRRVSARLLACARQLHPRSKPAGSTEPDAPTNEQPRDEGVLSIREREVARLVLEGKTYAEIGASIFISPRTAEHHIARIRRRLGATSRSDLIAKLRLALDGSDAHDQGPQNRLESA